MACGKGFSGNRGAEFSQVIAEAIAEIIALGRDAPFLFKTACFPPGTAHHKPTLSVLQVKVKSDKGTLDDALVDSGKPIVRKLPL
jgi:hypothetical protein